MSQLYVWTGGLCFRDLSGVTDCGINTALLSQRFWDIWSQIQRRSRPVGQNNSWATHSTQAS